MCREIIALAGEGVAAAIVQSDQSILTPTRVFSVIINFYIYTFESLFFSFETVVINLVPESIRYGSKFLIGIWATNFFSDILHWKEYNLPPPLLFTVVLKHNCVYLKWQHLPLNWWTLEFNVWTEHELLCSHGLGID